MTLQQSLKLLQGGKPGLRDTAWERSPKLSLTSFFGDYFAKKEPVDIWMLTFANPEWVARRTGHFEKIKYWRQLVSTTSLNRSQAKMMIIIITTITSSSITNIINNHHHLLSLIIIINYYHHQSSTPLLIIITIIIINHHH